MNKKFKMLVAAIGIMTLACPKIYAESVINYKINLTNQKCEIILDGQSVDIPDVVEFANGESIKLESFKKNLEANSGKISSIDYSNGRLTYNGALTITTINNEYVPIIGTDGIIDSTDEIKVLTDNFEKYHLLNKRKSQVESITNSISGTTDESQLKLYNIKLKHFTEDINRMENISISSMSKEVVSAIPYLAEKYSLSDIVDTGAETITSKVDVDYYVYTLMFRDLRINSMKYSINSGKYTAISNFDKDTYTYTVKLPESVPDDATITTSSTGYMNTILEQYNLDYDLGLEVQDNTIQLNNGMGTVKVKNVFKIFETYGEYLDEDYTSNPERVYTINFTKYDYLKGDLNRDGMVNATDSAVALDLYKYNNASDEDIIIGDMDNNGVINANDAALILDVYKYGN